jgi:hypothetical protein
MKGKKRTASPYSGQRRGKTAPRRLPDNTELQLGQPFATQALCPLFFGLLARESSARHQPRMLDLSNFSREAKTAFRNES